MQESGLLTDPGTVARHAEQLVESALAHRSDGAPPLVLERVASLRRRATERDHPDVMRTWPLHVATPLGDWFEHTPIEVVPRRPRAPMSDELRELVHDRAERWRGDDGVDGPALYADLLGPGLDHACESDREHRLWLAFALLTLDDRPWTRTFLYELPWPPHPDPAVRCLLLGMAYVDLPWPGAERFVYGATHDTDEPVFLSAFRIAGRRHDERAMDHLRPIVRSPAAILQALAQNRMFYPVGHAAASICCAELAILGTDDPSTAAEREAELGERVRRPLSEPVELARDRLAAALEAFEPPACQSDDAPADLDAMIEIPAGEFTFGVAEETVRDEWFDWSTCHPQRRVTLPAFHVDRFPVTNAQYDAWSDAIDRLDPSERRAHEHPGQEPGKRHRRNTRGDERYGPDHPVVGIDWFDAWAYAASVGKRLPTEHEWEKAARGPGGLRYPWGTEFRPDAARYAGETYGRDPIDLVEWMRLLAAGTADFPTTTTAPVDAHPAGTSGYGVADMCGNCWEYTTTAFFTDAEVRPAFAGFTPIELMGSREGHVVIRGGAWSSPAPLVAAPYRGYDLLTDRHSEIGFRCVWSPPQPSTTKEEDHDGR